MIPCKCIAKERDKNNVIVSYILADAYGNKCRISAQDLKQHIIEKKLQVINLKLTSDNRLIDEKIKVADNINTVYKLEQPSEFINNPKVVKPLYGKISSDNKLYTEYFIYFGDGVLKVSKSDWVLEIWPEYDGCTSAISRNGYSVYGNKLAQFKESIQSNFNKCIDKIHSGISGDLKFVDNFGVQYICKVYKDGKSYLDIWLVNSDVHISTERDIKWLMEGLDKAETRVQEVRELNGWNNGNRHSDGTKTRGNWFNKIFGNKA